VPSTEIPVPLPDYIEQIAQRAANLAVEKHLATCPAKDAVEKHEEDCEARNKLEPRVRKLELRFATWIGAIAASGAAGGATGGIVAGVWKYLAGS
jgi:hypothetical protein